MDQKTILNRNAKAEIQLMIADVTEERKKELIKQYHNPSTCLKNTNSQKILIGNWINNAVKMMTKGATKEDLERVVEHIVVLLGAVKYELDVKQSYLDRDLFGLTRKYFNHFKKVETKDGPIFIEEEKDVLKKRKELVEKARENRKELKNVSIYS